MQSEKVIPTQHLGNAVQEMCNVVTPNLAKGFLNLAMTEIKKNPEMKKSQLNNFEVMKDKLSAFFDFLVQEPNATINVSNLSKHYSYE